MSGYLHGDITGGVLGAAFEVHKTLGPGFLERVYEEALASELRRRNVVFEQQVEVPVWYKGDLVGTHILDLVVEGKVVVELKAVKAMDEIHISIVRSYLSATGLAVGLLLNFSRLSLEYKRVV